MNLNFLISLSEKDKRFLIALVIVFIVFFVLIAYLARLVRYLMKKHGRAVDGYMYDLCYYKIITNPKDFKKYVYKKEKISIYYRTRWFIRIFVVATVLFLAYALWIRQPETGEKTFAFAKEAMDALKLEFSGWPKASFFGLKIPNAFPHVVKKPEPLMTFSGIVTYAYALACLAFVCCLLRSAFIFIARMKRARQAADEVFTKKLDNLSMPIQK